MKKTRRTMTPIEVFEDGIRVGIMKTITDLHKQGWITTEQAAEKLGCEKDTFEILTELLRG